MTDYGELVKALRCCTSSSPDDCDICAYQPFCQRNGTGRERIMIDAAAAIEALQAELEKKRTEDCWGCKCEKLEPKRGEWVKNRVGFGWHCSYCKVDNYYAYCWNNEMGRSELKYNYCPNCGAKMEVQIIKSVTMREGDTDTDGFFRKAVEAVKEVRE